MFKKMMRLMGFVPESELTEVVVEASQQRIALRSLSHVAEARAAEIDRMADRYAQLRDENAGVVRLLLTELARSRS